MISGHIEQTLRGDALHPTDNWGTPDFFSNTGMNVYIDDFKFGHKLVEVYENWQLMNYAALVLQHLGVDGHTDQMVMVTFTIIQPRCYHRDGPIRSWTVRASDLRPYFNIMRNQFEAAMRDDAPCKVNSECDHCSARHVCEALQHSAYNAVEHAYKSIPLTMTPAATGLELRTMRRAAERLQARITSMEEQVIANIRRGISVPYFSLAHGQGRTVWTRPVEEIIALGVALGVNVSTPDVMTPKQAAKAGLMKEIVDAYSHAPTGAAKLVEDDGRAAAKIFKGN